MSAWKARYDLAKARLQDGTATAGQRVNLCGGSSPFLDAHYEKLASNPTLVCVRSNEGETWAGVIGEEPTFEKWLDPSEKHWLGHGGRGFQFMAEGELTVTHNLWSFDRVPVEYAHLFETTHEWVKPLTSAEDRAYWDAKEAADRG